MASLTIRTANPADEEHVIALRLESEAWLHAAGVEQWHDTARGIRNIREGIRDGVTFVVVDQVDRIVATLTLNGPDPDWWGPSDQPDTALYLYKLIIGADWRGTGLGDELLDWACEQAEERGKRWLRLDCWRTNVALHEYYKRRGFRHLRTDSVEGRGSGALFERDVTLRTAITKHLSH